MTEWNKIETANAHDFKEQAELEGTYKARQESQHGGFDFIVTNNDGDDVLVWGKTALQTKMSKVDEGTKVKIVYLGEVKSNKSGRVYQDFDVFTA